MSALYVADRLARYGVRRRRWDRVCRSGPTRPSAIARIGMIGRVGPQPVVVHGGQRKTLVVVALAVTQHGVDLARIVRVSQRAVVMLSSRPPSSYPAPARGAGAEARSKPSVPAVSRRLVGDAVAQFDVHRADRAEIALVGVIGALGVVSCWSRAPGSGNSCPCSPGHARGSAR